MCLFAQVCGDVRSQLKLVPDLQSRLSAVRRQLLGSAGTLHRSAIYVVVYFLLVDHFGCLLQRQ